MASTHGAALTKQYLRRKALRDLSPEPFPATTPWENEP